MTMRKRLLAAAALPAALVLSSAAHAGTVGLTLGAGGNDLVAFDLNDASTLSIVELSTRLDAIDFRPLTGELYGYSSSADEYYLIDPQTGIATLASDGAEVSTNGPNIGLDFNPTIDRSRTVGSNDENVVFNPNDGSTSEQTDLFYGAGDVNEGANPAISANAYSNSVANAATTQQFALDYNLNALTTLANNAGTLATVAGLTLNGSAFDFDSDTGFDIFTDDSGDIAFAVLSDGGLTGLFTLNLADGVLTQLGEFANNLGQINGLAVGDVAGLGEVPIPAALPLFFAGLAGLSFASRRKKAVA